MASVPFPRPNSTGSKNGIKTHINQEKEDSPISSLSTGTFEGNDFGFFGDDNVRPDGKRNLPLYTYGDVKYDADIIDRAVREYETYINQVQEKISTFTKSTKDIITNQVHGHVNVGKYGLILNNCQDYVSNILYIARRISEKERIPLILP